MTRTITVGIRNRKHLYTAFTMIELLVVMAIIFLLAGLSVGGYHKVRSKANQVTCLSNLKTIAYSMNMYMNDYYGYMIPYKNAQGDKWPTILVENEYLHEGTHFEPAGVDEGSAREVGMEPLFCYNDFSDDDVFFQDKYAAGGSYCINRDITSSSTVNRKWSHIQNAHKKILLCDYNQEGIEDENNFAISAQMNQNHWENGGSSSQGTIGRPHFGGTNCLFADWHAEFKHTGTFSTENFSLEMNFN